MTPHYADDWLTVYQGDARTVLATLPAESVDMVCTSPPYWGLRDYGTATWSGGDEGCDHKGEPMASSSSSLAGYTSESVQIRTQRMPMGQTCRKCGATRQDSQLGLEATPEEYVANLVAVFREVRRVLKGSGTCWLNLGDSYAAGKTGRDDSGDDGRFGGPRQEPTQRSAPPGLKPKDLVGIPWRVAFALQADGWYLRSDIIWAKPNPMPESVTDRPTKSHEYLFLLSKSARYYYDADAVAEQTISHPAGNGFDRDERIHLGAGNPEHWTPRPSKKRGEFNGKTEAMPGRNAFRAITATRNLRSVWTIATRPYPGAHFAVFPPELPERCIKAGSSERGVCPECGKPWERVREFTGELYMTPDMYGRPRTRVVTTDDYKTDGDTRRRRSVASGEPSGLATRVHTTTGWLATCGHPLKLIPATILDPFAGSGTVGLVANRLSRRAILIDLNAAYLEQQMQRNAQVPVGL